jgi:hypothetical protein
MTKKEKVDIDDRSVEIFTLEDGTKVNSFCMNQFNDLVSNTEVIYDILDIVTKLSKVEISRDENTGFVTDVELIIPRANEVVAHWALNNFLHIHEERGDSMSPETALELRRYRLQKYLSQEGVE